MADKPNAKEEVLEFDLTEADGDSEAGTADFDTMPEGLYAVNIYEYKRNDNGTPTFETKVKSGPYTGAQRSVSLGEDGSKELVKNSWMAVLLSIGKKPEDLKKKFKFKPSGLVGKDAILYFKPKATGEKYNVQKLVSPAFADKKRAEIAEAKKSAGNTSAPANGVTSGGTADKKSKEKAKEEPKTEQPKDVAEDILDL